MKKIELKSRKQFIQQVADTIENNHAKHGDSFIFGISGKWGEGKTTFLENLKGVLAKKGFTVVEFNPWKFASDKISFLRSFLSIIKSKIKINKIEKIWNKVLGKDESENLYYDIAINKINYAWLFSIVFLGIALVFIYSKLPESVRNEIKVFKWAITILLIPAGISLFGKIVSTQRSSRSISTLDNFENLLNEYIKQLNVNKTKLIVFVDDLDRVTPKVARNVLDNLRTFFDKKELSFIVAGDHTVLERYLGQDLLPNGSESEKLEEGRRFMKKIFNVYWRLPLPIDSELGCFLDNLFTEKSVKLEEIFSRKEDRKKLREYLARYFEKNFRHILRFVETIIFTFGIIKNSKESAEEGNKNYFEEMENSPLLVVRILMIQELCAPLFEKMTEDVNFFLELERFSDKKDSNNVMDRIDLIKESLSPFQKNFIAKFIFEAPKFFENTSLQVSDIRPFLHFAADAGFGDARGVSADDFAVILDKGNPEEVKQALVSSGENKITESADKFIEKTNSTIEATQKSNNINTIMNALINIPMEYMVHLIFLDKILLLNFDFYKQYPPQIRIENYLIFWQWLDKFNEREKTKEFEEKFIYTNQDDLNQFSAEQKFGKFSSVVIMSWLSQYFTQNKQDALSKISHFISRMDKTVAGEYITNISDDMLSFFVQDNDNNRMNTIYEIIVNYANNKSERLKSIVFEKIGNRDDVLWAFAISKSEGKNTIWLRKDAEKVIIDKLDSLEDVSQFIPILRYSIGRVSELLDDFWKIIIEKHLDFFMGNTSQFIDDGSFHPIAPNKKNAQVLFNRIHTYIKNMEDAQKIESLTILDKRKWLWMKLDEVDKKKLLLHTKSETEQVAQVANAILETWFPKESEGA